MSSKKEEIIEPLDGDFDDVAEIIVTKEHGKIPIATHVANFKEVFGFDVDYYVLADKQRLISKTGMASAIGQKSPRGNTFLRVMERQGIAKHVSAELRKKIENPVIFQPADLSAKPAHGYDATILIDVCNTIIQAERSGDLSPSQRDMFLQAQIINGASAKGGIVFLGDKLAGYNADRQEYIELYKQFIRDEARKYEPEFSDEFYDLFYRLYGLEKEKYKNHPQFFAHLTRKYVYQPLANSNGAILENLDAKNPVIYKSGRRYKLHQFLEDVGVKALRNHLGQIVGIGKLSPTNDAFKRNFAKVFGKQGELDLEGWSTPILESRI